jgi:hypothetical protein
VFWTPDSRRVLAMGTRSRAFLVNVCRGTKHRYAIPEGVLAGGAFSPDSSRLLLGESGGEEIGSLYIVRTGQPGPRELRQGELPVWSTLGVAYVQGANRLVFAKRPDRRPHRIGKTPGYPVAASDNGRRILVAEGNDLAGFRAVLVDPVKKEMHRLKVPFDSINGLSHDGRQILGVVAGDVVDVHPDGSVHVIVPSAEEPSWNE